MFISDLHGYRAQQTTNILIYLHSVGGYDCEFVDVPHDDDYCVICLLPARDPQQTKCECAKLYCKSCYDQLKSTSGTCPTCRQPLDAFPDRKSARKVKDLRVKCMSTGCSWVNELRLLADHLELCGYVLFPCANGCGDHMIRDNLPLHNKVCALRKHICEHCKSEGTYKEMTGGHLDECPDFKIPCTNRGCRVTIKRKKMASHRLLCPYETIHCPYKDVGCTYTSPRYAMEDHKTTSCGHHLVLAMAKLTSCGRDLDQAKVQLKSLNHKVTSLEQYQKSTPCVIKMPGFNQLNIKKKEWYSPGFYTHPYGYKMCLRVYANGSDDGEGTHVSVSLHLMKGENDDTLTWPIMYKCTITLLNQLNDVDHCLKTLYVMYISRVLTGETSGGRADPRFIPHDQLGLREDKQCQYLNDDSLYFRVQVEDLPACKSWLMVTVPSEDA